MGVIDINILCYENRGDEYKDHWDIPFNEFWQDRNAVRNYFVENDAILKDMLRNIFALQPMFIGFTNWYSNFQANIYIAEIIKKELPQCKILFGGPEIWMRHHNKMINYQEHSVVDVFIIGEGEETTNEIMQAMRDGKDIAQCPGVAIFDKDNALQMVQERHEIVEISSLPVPDFSDFDLSKYSAKGTLNLYMSRGCINRCIYCDERKYWSVFRSKSGAQVFNEVKEILTKYPAIKQLYFNDSLINGNIRELKEFCHLLIDSGLKVGWEVNAIIRKEMNKELLDLMAKAGCNSLIYGVETVSAKVLAHINKTLARDCNFEAIIRDTSSAGIRVWVNFMFGLPGETNDDAQQNIKFVINNKDFIYKVVPTFAFCNLSPFSEAYSNPAKYGIKENVDICFWESVDETNTYPIRLQRFERFCSEINKHNIGTTYPHNELVDRDKKLGFYYLYKKDFTQARHHLEKAHDQQPWDTSLAKAISAASIINNMPVIMRTGTYQILKSPLVAFSYGMFCRMKNKVKGWIT